MAQPAHGIEKRTALCVEAFNAGDVDAVEAMDTEKAPAVREPGVPLIRPAPVPAPSAVFSPAVRGRRRCHGSRS